MARIIPVDVSDHSINIFRDLSVRPSKKRPGPPERVDGMTVGILTMTEDAPHGGEIHPDGDEILYVISGKLRVTIESDPDAEFILGPGQACIVPRGEWHKVNVLEKTELMHITPGPGGDHRPPA